MVQDISSPDRFDWSYLEDETTNFALMAANTASTTTEVKSCSQKCTDAYNELKKQYDELVVKYDKAHLWSVAYERGLRSVEKQIKKH